jgi:hypothetical protein
VNSNRWTGINVHIQLLIKLLFPHPRDPGAAELHKLVQVVLELAPNEERQKIVDVFVDVIAKYKPKRGESPWFEEPSESLQELLELERKYLVLFRLNDLEEEIMNVHLSNASKLEHSHGAADLLKDALTSPDSDLQSRALTIVVALHRSGVEGVLNEDLIKGAFFSTNSPGNLHLQSELRNLETVRPVETTAALTGGKSTYADALMKLSVDVDLSKNRLKSSTITRIDDVAALVEFYLEDTNALAAFLTLIEKAKAKGYSVKPLFKILGHIQRFASENQHYDILRRVTILNFQGEMGVTAKQFCALTLTGKVVVH